jgi:hypothetical protein
MNNPYVMNMIVKQRQEEIRRQAEMVNRADQALRDSREWQRQEAMFAIRGLMLFVFLFGWVILI